MSAVDISNLGNEANAAVGHLLGTNDSFLTNGNMRLSLLDTYQSLIGTYPGAAIGFL